MAAIILQTQKIFWYIFARFISVNIRTISRFTFQPVYFSSTLNEMFYLNKLNVLVLVYAEAECWAFDAACAAKCPAAFDFAGYAACDVVGASKCYREWSSWLQRWVRRRV